MKNYTLPEWSIKYSNQTLKNENTPLIILSVCKLTFDGNTKTSKKLNRFYSQILDGFINFASTAFYNYALANYQADENPRKKYRYAPFCLSLQIDCKNINENNIRTIMTVQISKNKVLLAKKQITNTWQFSKKHLFLIKNK